MLRKILTIPPGIFFLLLALGALFDGNISSFIFFGLIGLILFCVAFPIVSGRENEQNRDKSKNKKSDSETENEGIKSSEKDPLIGRIPIPPKPNGSKTCRHCGSINMKGSSGGFCFECQRKAAIITAQNQPPPFMRYR